MRLEERLNKVQGKGNYAPFLRSLRQYNPPAYKHLRQLSRGAMRKYRRGKQAA